jgi:multiple antibiotic resistance protein
MENNSIPLVDIFITVFIGMGPIKVLLVYIGVTQGASRDLQRRVAQKAVMTATIVGLLLLVAGAIFMQILHFSTSALTIAGGLILLILALSIVLSPAPKEDHKAAPDEKALLSMAIYPMGIPLLLNPVGIVSLTVFSAETQSLVGLAIIAAMILVVAAIDFGIFLVSHRLDKYLTHERILVMEKLLGILLAALAVQMMLNGLQELGIIAMTGGGH